MTSGQFTSLPLSSITVNREERQRRELKDIPELADSVARLGLIHPIVVDRDGVLVAGERRLAACSSLGWTHINVQFADELSSHQRRAIELEENVKRQQLPWLDECKAILDYHNLRKEEDSAWSQEDTARALGISEGLASSKINVAKEALAGNATIVSAPKLSTAIGLVARKAERVRDAATLELRGMTPAAAEPARSILNEDFLKWAPTYKGPKFNFIHCDFPYGIGADKRNQGDNRFLHGEYDDSENTYWNLLSCLLGSMDRLCADSSHLMFWFSMQYYTSTLAYFVEHSDWIVDPFPLVWVKSDNSGLLPDASRGPRRIYETAFFASRGDRKIVRAKSNAFSAPTVNDIHMSIKPEPVLAHFFSMFVDETTSFLDPTCGSGSSVRAAEALGAAKVLGLEVNKEFAGRAEEALKRARAERKVEDAR